MPSWNEVLQEIQEYPNSLDSIRRKYLNEYNKITGRNVIAYYSGWLQKPGLAAASINDADKTAIMATVHKLDRTKGLDIILHTPGGEIAATESIVDYLRKMFGEDITAIIPQIAMSCGTMIACSCKRIIMGKQSNIGPIDPQFNGIPVQGVIEEFKRAIKAVKENPSSLPIWQVIVSKYHPTFIGDCEKADEWAKTMVIEWLKTCMFKGQSTANEKASKVVEILSAHETTKTHARHIDIDACEKMGLVIDRMETLPNNLQDIILTIHHTYMHTFSQSAAIKIVENQIGNAIVLHATYIKQ